MIKEETWNYAGQLIRDVIEDAKGEMCDHYCKYSDQLHLYNEDLDPDAEFPKCCENCPLDIF